MARVRDTHPVDAAAHYKHLIALGRDDFLAAAAPAALVRFQQPTADGSESGDRTMTIDDGTIDETLDHGSPPRDIELEVYPLIKKAGASFPDRITIGRTGNNDIVVQDHSVSRLHAYVRLHGSEWVVADAGSKNGSWLRGSALEARRERILPSRSVLRLGDVDLTFFVAVDLFHALGGS